MTLAKKLYSLTICGDAYYVMAVLAPQFVCLEPRFQLRICGSGTAVLLLGTAVLAAVPEPRNRSRLQALPGTDA